MKWLRWIDDNLVKIFGIIFIFLIPLYPKFPLKFIDYTYIALRLEDIFVAIMGFVFLVQHFRKKVTLNKHFLYIIVFFWFSVFLSFLWGAFVQKTVIYKHLGLLHSLRRVEYSIIFFVIASSIKNRKDFIHYLSSVFLTLTAVCIYGVGQKFFGFPAIQTMNPEFAKGHILFLTPEARVSSTFAGHYDLAAYLVFLLPLTIALYFWKKKFVYFLLYLAALFALTLTSSRSSSLAYLISIISFLFYIKKLRVLLVVLIISVSLSFGSNSLASRWAQALRVKQIYINEQTGQVVVPQKMSTKELPAGSLYVEINKPLEKTSSQTAKLLQEKIIEDLQDEAKKSGKTLTATEAAELAATISADLKPVSTVVSDISFATRIQVEWPRAIKAFIKNPLLGSGPSSITEATDGDYFRWLGETGLLGTIIFLYFLFSAVKFILLNIKELAESEKFIYFGYIFGLLGLFINASYIDVFEASKVAYTFWAITGIMIGSLTLSRLSNSKLAK